MADGALICPNCRREGDPGERFCAYCGSQKPAAAPPEALPEPPPDASREPEARAQATTPERRAPTEEKSPVPAADSLGRIRGFGPTIIRVALGFLFLYPMNPIVSGYGWPAPDVETWEIGPVEYWAHAAFLADRLDVIYAVSTIQLLAGVLIILGLLFRPACVVMAATFIAIWIFVFVDSSTIEVQLEYLGFAVAFLGLMLVGPGRLALRRRRD